MATNIIGGMKKIRNSINKKNLGLSSPTNNNKDKNNNGKKDIKLAKSPKVTKPAIKAAPKGGKQDGGDGGGSKCGKGGECDFIQKLFLDKLREYKKLSKDGKMVDPSKEILDELNKKLEACKQKFNLHKGDDVTKFPKFEWKEPDIDPISLKELLAKEKTAAAEEAKKKKNKEQATKQAKPANKKNDKNKKK